MIWLNFQLRYLLPFGILIILLAPPPAQANAIAVSFDLPHPQQQRNQPTTHPLTPVPRTVSLPSPQPLPIPQAAGRPPLQSVSAATLKAEGGLDSLNIASSRQAVYPQLPPPPVPLGAVPHTQILPPLKSQTSPPSSSTAATPLGIKFPQPTTAVTPLSPLSGVAAISTPDQAPPAPQPPPSINRYDWIFAGDSDSLVARSVGSAEGTRTPDGKKTQAYYGHSDPGNGVWNLGTFSYQHGAPSPAAADVKQLARLKRQQQALAHNAHQKGIQLDLIKVLNGLDLANQSPAAALNRGGYIDRLAEAQARGLAGNEAILWARTYAYMNPDTRRWNAPGLGNTEPSIRRDQNRRLQAVAAALTHYEAQTAVKKPRQPIQPLADVALNIPAANLPQATQISENSSENTLTHSVAQAPAKTTISEISAASAPASNEVNAHEVTPAADPGLNLGGPLQSSPYSDPQAPSETAGLETAPEPTSPPLTAVDAK